MKQFHQTAPFPTIRFIYNETPMNQEILPSIESNKEFFTFIQNMDQKDKAFKYNTDAYNAINDFNLRFSDQKFCIVDHKIEGPVSAFLYHNPKQEPPYRGFVYTEQNFAVNLQISGDIKPEAALEKMIILFKEAIKPKLQALKDEANSDLMYS